MESGQESPPRSSKDNVNQPVPKRRRIALACSACRIRKSRCNGGRPKCDACDKLGFECTYEQQETSANLLIPKDLFATLEHKVKMLEASLETHNNRLNHLEKAQPKPLALYDKPLAADSLQPENGVSDDGITIDDDVVINIEGIKESSTGQSMTDGMAVSFVDEQDCGFFGPSSNIAFMRHILRAVDKRKQLINDQSPVTSVSEHTPLGGSDDISKADANRLPPDHEMQRLINAYFTNTGILFPYIHEQEFLDTYHQFRASSFRSNVSRTWLGLLNMILAMATCTSCWEDTGSESHFEQSDVFYRRAQELCQAQMLRGTTLEIVQYLLLTSQYLQGTHRSVQTWTIHGLAVKAAMSIGLHSRDIVSKFNPVQQEIRKRTWFGCILLDRSLSLTFGRPCAIPEDYIRLDLPHHLLLYTSVSEQVQYLSTEFYNASILLYRIIGKVITALYGNNLGCDEQASDTITMTAIIQFEQELSDWQDKLPQQLRPCSADELAHRTDTEAQDTTVERFRVILTLRYLNTQLLLHRPTFIRSLSAFHKGSKIPNRNSGSVNSMQASFDRAFIQVAKNILDIIHTALMRPDHGRHLIGAWWFTLYYTFSAALAVFGGLLVNQDLVDESDVENRHDRAKRSLNQGYESLLQLSNHNPIVLRCVRFLQQLVRIVNTWEPKPSHSLRPQSQYLEPHSAENIDCFDLDTDLISTMPSWDTSDLGFRDELELGQFFASDIQKWFERVQ
ncbi:hypothetical protein FVEN_g9299 [Fusarium venenatum]|nr:hypothetical protein FVEN_g9299 [Fusarium venenatum]